MGYSARRGGQTARREARYCPRMESKSHLNAAFRFPPIVGAFIYNVFETEVASRVVL